MLSASYMLSTGQTVRPVSRVLTRQCSGADAQVRMLSLHSVMSARIGVHRGNSRSTRQGVSPYTMRIGGASWSWAWRIQRRCPGRQGTEKDIPGRSYHLRHGWGGVNRCVRWATWGGDTVIEAHSSVMVKSFVCRTSFGLPSINESYKYIRNKNTISFIFFPLYPFGQRCLNINEPRWDKETSGI